MTILTEPRWDVLLDPQAGVCVSLYMPSPRFGPQTRQSPVRLRRLLAQARQNGGAQAMGPVEQELEALLADRDFWQRQRGGLAVFGGSGGLEVVMGWLAFAERIHVGPCFCLTPLLPMRDEQARFDLLSLSQHQVRLYALDRDDIRPRSLPGLPRTLEDVVGWDYRERSLQFHTRSGHERMQMPASGAAHRRAMYFGHGENADQDKNEVMRFCHRVDEVLLAATPPPRPMLILAAVQYVAAIYRQASRYPQLFPREIAGNCDHLNAHELHAKAWQLIRNERDADKARTARQVRGQIESDSVSTDLFDILTAASDGRIETLYVCGEEPIWGHFSASGRYKERHSVPRRDDEDLLNLAVVQALRTGASVQRLEAGALNEHRLAARYRY